MISLLVATHVSCFSIGGNIISIDLLSKKTFFIQRNKKSKDFKRNFLDEFHGENIERHLSTTIRGCLPE